MVKRVECPECHEQKKLARFRYNPVKEKRICYDCDKRIGHNKFFNQEVNGGKERNKFMRLQMTDDEKKELWISLVKTGMSEEQARWRVNSLNYRLKMQERRRMFTWSKVRKEESNNINKKFLEGLGQIAR